MAEKTHHVNLSTQGFYSLVMMAMSLHGTPALVEAVGPIDRLFEGVPRVTKDQSTYQPWIDALQKSLHDERNNEWLLTIYRSVVKWDYTSGITDGLLGLLMDDVDEHEEAGPLDDLASQIVMHIYRCQMLHRQICATIGKRLLRELKIDANIGPEEVLCHPEEAVWAVQKKFNVSQLAFANDSMVLGCRGPLLRGTLHISLERCPCCKDINIVRRTYGVKNEETEAQTSCNSAGEVVSLRTSSTHCSPTSTHSHSRSSTLHPRHRHALLVRQICMQGTLVRGIPCHLKRPINPDLRILESAAA